MPRKGDKQQYRIVLKYPDERQYVFPHSTLDSALRGAARSGGLGADVKVLDVTRKDAPLARFGPGVLHAISRTETGGGACSCGSLVYSASDLRDHVEHVGVCADCLGSGDALDPNGLGQVECPVCQATGDAARVDYWEVKADSYRSKFTTLMNGPVVGVAVPLIRPGRSDA